MGKMEVLFEAVVDLAVSFVFVALAFWITRTTPSGTFVLWIAGVFTLFGACMDLARRKAAVRVVACGLSTFIGSVLAGAVVNLLN